MLSKEIKFNSGITKEEFIEFIETIQEISVEDYEEESKDDFLDL